MKKLKKIIFGILAGLGALFVLILIIPTDDEGTDSQEVYEESKSVAAPFANATAVSVGTNAKNATIMIYMNGSDLESEAGEATRDISEMIDSGIGDNINVIIQTMGTKEWQDYGIASDRAQTYKIENGGLTLIRDDLGQLDCTSKNTLSEFIGFCKNNYPADRYLFLFWNHGGGPVYGFGYDEWQPEESSLTIAEMAEAFSEHTDIHFDIVGMDCCIMASMETCYALAPYCKYALLSEDFESGLGWSYAGWMKNFEENTGISTPLLGKYIVDDIISENETSYEGDSACIGLFNLSTSRNLYKVWKEFAYKNEKALLGNNYSKIHRSKGRSKGFWDFWGFDDSDVTLSDYYISDMLALVENIDNESDEAKNLISALKASIAYYGHTSDKNELTGLAVSLPYGDSEFYDQLAEVYGQVGFDSDYINWLGRFVSSDGYDDYYDYGEFEDSWSGWGAYEDDYGCNISGNGSCEYAYDYDSDECYNDSEGDDDWIYDYEEDIWYCYEGDTLYLYDEESDTVFYYDEEEDEIYYYDEEDDEWYIMED